jgi:hypothetical protein
MYHPAIRRSIVYVLKKTLYGVMSPKMTVSVLQCLLLGQLRWSGQRVYELQLAP